MAQAWMIGFEEAEVPHAPPVLNLSDVPVRTSVWLVQDGEPLEVPITWRQRLLSWPWRPWRRTRTVVPKVPYKGALSMEGGRYLLMHPATYAELRAAMRKR